MYVLTMLCYRNTRWRCCRVVVSSTVAACSCRLAGSSRPPTACARTAADAASPSAWASTTWTDARGRRPTSRWTATSSTTTSTSRPSTATSPYCDWRRRRHRMCSAHACRTRTTHFRSARCATPSAGGSLRRRTCTEVTCCARRSCRWSGGASVAIRSSSNWRRTRCVPDTARGASTHAPATAADRWCVALRRAGWRGGMCTGWRASAWGVDTGARTGSTPKSSTSPGG